MYVQPITTCVTTCDYYDEKKKEKKKKFVPIYNADCFDTSSFMRFQRFQLSLES